jgi:hypothetical protein
VLRPGSVDKEWRNTLRYSALNLWIKSKIVIYINRLKYKCDTCHIQPPPGVTHRFAGNAQIRVPPVAAWWNVPITCQKPPKASALSDFIQSAPSRVTPVTSALIVATTIAVAANPRTASASTYAAVSSVLQNAIIAFVNSKGG